MKNEKGFTTYECKVIKGAIPDGQCTQWWTQKDWDNFDQRVTELKRTGEYGKEDTVYLTLKDDPEWDIQCPPISERLKSSRIEFIDTQK